MSKPQTLLFVATSMSEDEIVHFALWYLSRNLHLKGNLLTSLLTVKDYKLFKEKDKLYCLSFIFLSKYKYRSAVFYLFYHPV